MSNKIERIKPLLEIKRIDSYTKCGCNLRPRTKNETLYQIDYWSKSREFGTVDMNEAAIALAKEQFENIHIRLSAPSLVFAVRNNIPADSIVQGDFCPLNLDRFGFSQ